MNGNPETSLWLGKRKAEYEALASANGVSLSFLVRRLLEEAARVAQTDSLLILQIDLTRLGRPRKDPELKR